MALTGDVSDSYFDDMFGDNERYANPFYGIPLQYLPLSMDKMLWWAEHFLLRFGFYRTALERIANYFITQLNVDCDDDESKEEYKEVFEKMGWKAKLAESGLNILAYGQCFNTINQGFNRFLICPQCGKVSLIDRIDTFTFAKGKFTYQCPGCDFKGVHKVVNKPNKDITKIHIRCWPPREIKLRHEEVTGESEYFWEIPQLYKNKITGKGNRFYAKKMPEVVYETIFENKMVAFNNKNFIHIKMPTPASLKTDGKAIPLCIYLFDDFFMLKVLQRFNEAICFEDINPFRVIAMDPGTNMGNPIFGGNQNGSTWKEAVDKMIGDHRKDPGSYHTFPFPLNFQQLGGEGKNLAPVELMQMAQNNILNALNIPQELYTMSLQVQAIGPALRLFENSWSTIVDSYNQLIQHWGDVVGKIRGLAPAKFTLLKSTFADNLERKSVIAQLVASNSISRSEMLNLYDLDFKDQLRKKMQEDIDAKELQQEEQDKEQIKSMNDASIFGQQGQGAGGGQMGATQMGGQSSPSDNVGSGVGSTPQDILQQAQQIAQQLQPMSGSDRRQELQKIKAQNEQLWGSVKAQLQQMDQGAESQGLQQSKQGEDEDDDFGAAPVIRRR